MKVESELAPRLPGQAIIPGAVDGDEFRTKFLPPDPDTASAVQRSFATFSQVNQVRSNLNADVQRPACEVSHRLGIRRHYWAPSVIQ